MNTNLLLCYEARADPALGDQSGSAALHHACAERGREAYYS